MIDSQRGAKRRVGYNHLISNKRECKTRILIGVAEFVIRLTSSSGVTGARDQSLESSQSDWSTKFCKTFGE